MASQREHPSPSCSVTLAVTGSFLSNATTSLEVMNNVSDHAVVYTHSDSNGTRYAYLGVPESVSLSNRDFTAKTYGASTQCYLISKKCSLRTYASSVLYDCSDAFNGTLTSSGLETAFFSNKSMAKDTKQSMYDTGVGNPYYYAIASTINFSGGKVPDSPQFVQSLHGPYTYVLGCNSTIYDVQYSRVNNTISRFVPTVSNISVSNIWQTSIAHTIDWEPFIQQAAGAAIFSNTGQQFADKISHAFSKVTIALGADAVNAQPALAAQDRETFLVARIPAAPLITLVVVNFLYVVCGLIFTILALVAARSKVPDIQARLSIAGLVADRFEDPGFRSKTDSVEKMFEEYSGKSGRRVAIEAPDEDCVYRYTTWGSDRSSSVRLLNN